MFNNVGIWWLDGNKYNWSRSQVPQLWDMDIKTALGHHGINIDSCTTMHDVVRLFRGRYFWKPDDFFQIWDRVIPPVELLARKGDDCDGWAMLHAQAMEYVLKPRGWKVYIISYLANPWWQSHHYVTLVEPSGAVWVVQPQPTEAQWVADQERNQTVYGPYRSVEETLPLVASWYRASVVWWDKRTPRWEKVS